jgi:hypothetical protein
MQTFRYAVSPTPRLKCCAMKTKSLLFLVILGLGIPSCNDDDSAQISNDGGVTGGDASVLLDAPVVDASIDTKVVDAALDTMTVKIDGAIDAVAAGDAASCPDLTGVYTPSFGGNSCGDFSPLAVRQRIDGSNCKFYFEYDGNAKLGVDGSFTAGPNGSFGPVMLKVGTQQALCSGTTPTEGVVRLSCNNGACLINFTYTRRL